MTTQTRGEQGAGETRTNQGAGAVEVRSIDYVPVSERHGKPWHLGPVWFQGNAQLATLAVGLLGPSLGLNFIWSAIAIILGILVGTLFMAFHSAQGPKLGLPQMIQSRAQFGFYGSLLPVIVAVLLFIGFNVFNTILGGQILQVLFPSWSNFIADLPMVILAVALTIVGYHYIHIGLRWATWLFIVAYGIFTIGALFNTSLPSGSFSLGSFHFGLFLVQFGAVVSYQLTWAPYVSEYSRYLPEDTPTSSVFWWTYGGSAVGAGIMLLGAFILAPHPTLEPIAAVNQSAQQIFHGFGTILLICSIPGLVAVLAMNVYSGALSSLTTVDTIKRIKPNLAARWVAALFIAIAAFALALLLPSNFLTNFNNFLLICLYFIIPWTAINLIDFFFVRHERYAILELFKPNGLYGPWSWRGLVSYALGFAVMIPFMSTTIWEGPVAKSLSGGDISPFIGFPVAAICYYLVSRDIDVPAEVAIAEQQRPLLEAEARAHAVIGTAEEEDLLDDVGARVADGLTSAGDDETGVERHPSA